MARSEALRQAMLSLIDGPGRTDPATGRTLFSYAHPIFWAPFSLVGDGGGRHGN
jgi:CHAT domain-containing protein